MKFIAAVRWLKAWVLEPWHRNRHDDSDPTPDTLRPITLPLCADCGHHLGRHVGPDGIACEHEGCSCPGFIAIV